MPSWNGSAHVEERWPSERGIVNIQYPTKPIHVIWTGRTDHWDVAYLSQVLLSRVQANHSFPLVLFFFCLRTVFIPSTGDTVSDT